MISTGWMPNGVILHDCSGKIGIEDLAKVLVADLTDERYMQTVASLWDLRGIDSSVNLNQLDTLAEHFLSLLKDTPLRRVAWVVEFRMSAAIIDGYYKDHPWPSIWRTFHTRSAAERWCIGVDT